MFASKHNFPVLFFSLVTIKSNHTEHQNIITPTTNYRSNKTQPCHVISPLQMKPPSYGNSRHKQPLPAPLESPSHSPSPSQNHHRISTPNSPLAFTRFLQRPPRLPTTKPPLCHTQTLPHDQLQRPIRGEAPQNQAGSL